MQTLKHMNVFITFLRSTYMRTPSLMPHSFLYSSNYFIVPTLPPKLIITYNSSNIHTYTFTRVHSTYVVFLVLILYLSWTINTENFTAYVGTCLWVILILIHSVDLTTVALHLFIGLLCEIFLDTIGIPTEVVVLSIFFRPPYILQF